MPDREEMTDKEHVELVRSDIDATVGELHSLMLNNLPDGPFKHRALDLLNLARQAAIISIGGPNTIDMMHQYALEALTVTDPAYKDQYLRKIAEMTATPK